MTLAADERRDFADLLDSLTVDQWDTPSLCEGWSVRDVVAHMLSFEDLSLLGALNAFARGGFWPARINRQRLEAFAALGPDELRERMRNHLHPRGITTGFGGALGLTDALIHHQDIRRPLALPRTIPADRLTTALAMAYRAPVLPVRRNARGLRVEATDIAWSRGSGPVVRGPGEAILLALAGRRPALDDLDGDGLALLRSRLTRTAATDTN